MDLSNTSTSAVNHDQNPIIQTDASDQGSNRVGNQTEPSLTEARSRKTKELSILESFLGRKWCGDDCRRVHRRMCVKLGVLGLSFAVDVSDEVYDDVLESAVRQDIAYLKSRLEATWSREDEDLIYHEIIRQIQIFSDFAGCSADVPVSEENIGRYLKTRIHYKVGYQGAVEAEICVVCQDPLYQEGCTTIAMLECEHEYHAKCIKSWLTREKNNCPICKARAI